MLNNKTIAVVVPAYNEETQIGIVIDTMPAFVDRIIIVNDFSKDKTFEIVCDYIKRENGNSDKTISIPYIEPPIETIFNKADVVLFEMRREEVSKYPPHEIFNDKDTDRIVLINNKKNARVGGAIKIGYKWCRDHGIDCTSVMAGDAQMDPDELESICLPVVEDDIDYVKGNRLWHGASRIIVPKKRFFGNSVLSAMTKVASGFWRISDTQTGYTSISLRALNKLSLYSIYNNYGVPNDILIKLNIAHCTIREIPIKPVYNVGEQSKMKIGKVIPTVSWLLVKGFYKRIFSKYLINDFHPIFVFYSLSVLSLLSSIYFLVYIIIGLCHQAVSSGTYFGFVLSLILCILLFSFGMWFDMIDNERLQK
ncbi:MAG: glycosyltransferase family 2 protein [Oscillospiraceae bacterium]|nr:glycosyltransferase family 2 protein [Oscillospiraceae bacterium]